MRCLHNQCQYTYQCRGFSLDLFPVWANTTHRLIWNFVRRCLFFLPVLMACVRLVGKQLHVFVRCVSDAQDFEVMILPFAEILLTGGVDGAGAASDRDDCSATGWNVEEKWLLTHQPGNIPLHEIWPKQIKKPFPKACGIFLWPFEWPIVFWKWVCDSSSFFFAESARYPCNVQIVRIVLFQLESPQLADVQVSTTPFSHVLCVVLFCLSRQLSSETYPTIMLFVPDPLLPRRQVQSRNARQGYSLGSGQCVCCSSVSASLPFENSFCYWHAVQKLKLCNWCQIFWSSRFRLEQRCWIRMISSSTWSTSSAWWTGRSKHRICLFALFFSFFHNSENLRKDNWSQVARMRNWNPAPPNFTVFLNCFLKGRLR